MLFLISKATQGHYRTIRNYRKLKGNKVIASQCSQRTSTPRPRSFSTDAWMNDPASETPHHTCSVTRSGQHRAGAGAGAGVLETARTTFKDHLHHLLSGDLKLPVPQFLHLRNTDCHKIRSCIDRPQHILRSTQ